MIYTEISSNNLVIERVKALYIDSFPQDERRDFEDIINLLDNKEKTGFSMIGIFLEDESFAGFITVWNFNTFRYVEHFAISPALRGRKIGENALEHLKTTSSIPIILEVEPPISEMSKRRIAFYERCGFYMHGDVNYIQPAYNPTLNSIELKLMSWGKINLKSNCNEIKVIHKNVYGVQ